mmetsp:Transcript_44469/g.96733  ORF Transcript_44469/g.96733 Transcript_44469/m.96733 type:complete len:332 (+) Transcript_44469:497-1492(+)
MERRGQPPVRATSLLRLQTSPPRRRPLRPTRSSQPTNLILRRRTRRRRRTLTRARAARCLKPTQDRHPRAISPWVLPRRPMQPHRPMRPRHSSSILLQVRPSQPALATSQPLRCPTARLQHRASLLPRATRSPSPNRDFQFPRPTQHRSQRPHRPLLFHRHMQHQPHQHLRATVRLRPSHLKHILLHSHSNSPTACPRATAHLRATQRRRLCLLRASPRRRTQHRPLNPLRPILCPSPTEHRRLRATREWVSRERKTFRPCRPRRLAPFPRPMAHLRPRSHRPILFRRPMGGPPCPVRRPSQRSKVMGPRAVLVSTSRRPLLGSATGARLP